MAVRCTISIHRNVVESRSVPVLRYNVFTYEGSDAPWVMDSGRLQDNTFSHNTIIGARESIELTVADGTAFVDNTFKNTKTIRFEDSMGTVMSGNTGLDRIKLKVTDGSCFNQRSDAAYNPIC